MSATDPYNGYRNQATFEFCSTVDNHEALYYAVRDYARDLLRGLPTMSDQALGRNVRDRVLSWAFGGGWGFDNPPMFRQALGHWDRDEMASAPLSEEDIAECIRSMLEADGSNVLGDVPIEWCECGRPRGHD